MLLDEDEFELAVGREQIEPDVVVRARAEAERVMDAARRGDWPPDVVQEWTLERALAALDTGEP